MPGGGAARCPRAPPPGGLPLPPTIHAPRWRLDHIVKLGRWECAHCSSIARPSLVQRAAGGEGTRPAAPAAGLRGVLVPMAPATLLASRASAIGKESSRVRAPRLRCPGDPGACVGHAVSLGRRAPRRLSCGHSPIPGARLPRAARIHIEIHLGAC